MKKQFISRNFVCNQQFFNSVFNYQDGLIKKTMQSFKDLSVNIIILIKKIVKTWLDNCTQVYKKQVLSSSLFLAFYDIYYNGYDEFFTFPNYKGNEMCDITLNLQMIYTITIHLLQLIENNFNDFIRAHCTALKTKLRFGLLINKTNIIYEELLCFIEEDGEYYILINMDYSTFNYQKLTAFMSSKKQLIVQIKMMLAWVIQIIFKIMINIQAIDQDTNLVPFLFNLGERDNLIEKIFFSYIEFLKEIKQVKEDMIAYKCETGTLQIKIDLSKRNKSKPRQRAYKNKK